MDELYIPGDLVFHYIPKTTIKKYVKVYVCSTNNVLSLEDMDGNLYDYIGVLYPIPLTPDILEKNGWKIEDVNPNDLSNIVSKGIMYRAIKDKEILFFQKGASVFTCPLNWRKIEIRYVHQLQHLLFGLGLNSEMEV